MILRGLEVGLGCNCYIIGSEKTKEAMIIDPGGDADWILDTVRKLGLKVNLIILTHGHMDHVGAINEVKQATGAEVVMHADAVKTLPGQTHRTRQAFGVSFTEPQPPDRVLHGGEKITVGDLTFQVINTPGHSPGGICLWGEGVVFSGDTLFAGGIGRYDFPNSDYNQLMDSLMNKLMALPDETVVYPGHGPHSTIGNERRYNPFLTGRAF